MSKFRTQLPGISYPFQINHSDAVMGMGSCFAEHMSHLLAQYKFQSLLNPFGILYNPISIAKGIQRILSDDQIREEELFYHQGVWHSFQFHGVFSHADRAKALEGMNHSVKKAQHFLKKASRLMITFGTANVFEHLEEKEIVANCHKLPGHAFRKRRLSVEEVVQAMSGGLQKLQEMNPDLQVILTVSPVRHIRDGLIENQRSKAVLHLAVAELVDTLHFVHYFPSYELIMDDLRDYRFFKKDMIHPTEQAIDYIWDYFSQAFFSEDTLEIIRQVHKTITASQHRPFHPDSPEHQHFLKKQLEQLASLLNKYPFLDFSNERNIFEEQLRVE